MLCVCVHMVTKKGGKRGETFRASAKYFFFKILNDKATGNHEYLNTSPSFSTTLGKMIHRTIGVVRRASCAPHTPGASFCTTAITPLKLQLQEGARDTTGAGRPRLTAVGKWLCRRKVASASFKRLVATREGSRRGSSCKRRRQKIK